MLPPPFSWCFANNVDEKYEGYAVVSEYFGRGLFNKVTVIMDSPPAAASAPSVAAVTSPAPAPAPAPTYGPGAEAKLRQQEGQDKQMFIPNAPKQMAPKGTAVIPVPEGRMRLIERQQYSSSLEANLTQLEPRVHAKVSPLASPKPNRKTEDPKSSKGSPNDISSAISNEAGSNPFEENYDESKNPFADDSNVSTNPFSEEDDYDNNLNPFS